MKSTIKLLNNYINEAEAIVVGAGSGLSTSAGFKYDGKEFLDNFYYMYQKYGYKDMYTAGFHHFKTSEEKWGYWAKYIYLNRYKYKENKLYKKLYSLFKDKNYFVITTNVDHQFQLAGFDKKRLFYTQGDYGLLQCPTPCHNKTYNNEEIILKMLKETKEHKIPSSLIPKCPICHKEMVLNLRSDNSFVEDNMWHEAKERYLKFIEDNKDKKILFIELGVGFNTPSIIKFPFINMTYDFINSKYVVINKEKQYKVKEIIDKTLEINNDIKEVVDELIDSNN